MNVKPLFKLMADKKASDLFFTTYAPVMIKIDGRLQPVNQMELTPKMIRQAALELMNEEQLEEFTRELETPVGCDSDDDGVIDELDECPIEEGEGDRVDGCLV